MAVFLQEQFHSAGFVRVCLFIAVGAVLATVSTLGFLRGWKFANGPGAFSFFFCEVYNLRMGCQTHLSLRNHAFCEPSTKPASSPASQPRHHHTPHATTRYKHYQLHQSQTRCVLLLLRAAMPGTLGCAAPAPPLPLLLCLPCYGHHDRLWVEAYLVIGGGDKPLCEGLSRTEFRDKAHLH
jgi:hypothetical protein